MVILQGNTFTQNRAIEEGGAVATINSNLSISDSEFRENAAIKGSAIANLTTSQNGTTVSVVNSTLENNVGVNDTIRCNTLTDVRSGNSL